MQLTDEQKQAVAGWFAAGASLDEIQKRLRSDFDVHLTYLDVRLLVAELPQPVEPEPPAPPEPVADEVPPEDLPPADEEPPPGTEPCEALPPEEAAEDAVKSTLEITVDTLTIPGTMASGEVTFSDGQKGKWYLDQMGRLGLGGDLPPGYRPAPADAALFQARLVEALRAKGLC